MQLIAFLILILASAAPAFAQARPGSAVPAVNPHLLVLPEVSGATVTCYDFRNRYVRFVDVPDLGDAGRAEFVYGNGPVIMIDPELMGALPPALQVFFKLHECGHHALGHLVAPNSRSEREADCWAIARGHTLAVFDRAMIESWRPSFAQSRGDLNGHLPGAQRVDFLLSCYDDPSGTFARLE